MDQTTVIIYDYRASRRIWKTIYLLKKNTEKFIIFSVPRGKEVPRTDKKGNQIAKHIYLADYNLWVV